MLTQWLAAHRSLAIAAAGLVFVLIVAGLSLNPWRTSSHRPSGEAKRWFDIGTKGLRDGSFYQAGRAFEKAIAADDAYILARARLAESFVEQDLIEKAKDELLRVNAADRSSFSALDSHYLDAVIATATNGFARAIENYQVILRQTPDAEKHYVLVDLARAQEKNQDLKQAANSYQEAITLCPEYATAFLRLGVLYGIQRDLAKGRATFDKAEALYQADGNLEGRAEVAVQRGTLLSKVNKLADARSAVERALILTKASENKSQEISALLQLSGVLADLGETEQATTYAREALDRAQSRRVETLTARGLVDLGNAFRTAGMNAEAETAFNQSLEAAQRSKTQKSEARARLSLASLYLQQNKMDQAERHLGPTLSFYQQGGYQTEAFQGLILLARINRNKGDYETALRASEQLLQIANQKNDQSLVASAHSELGAVLLARGNFPDALAHQKEACQIYKTLGVQRSLAYNLASQGNARLRLGKFKEARASLAEAKAIADRPSGGYRDLTILIRLAGAEAALIQGRHSEGEAGAREALDQKTGPSRTQR